MWCSKTARLSVAAWAWHQYCRIGSLAMVAGGTRVNQDLVPYFMYSGLYATPHGLNLVGLRRAGFTRRAGGRVEACL